MLELGAEVAKHIKKFAWLYQAGRLWWDDICGCQSMREKVVAAKMRKKFQPDDVKQEQDVTESSVEVLEASFVINHEHRVEGIEEATNDRKKLMKQHILRRIRKAPVSNEVKILPDTCHGIDSSARKRVLERLQDDIEGRSNSRRQLA